MGTPQGGAPPRRGHGSRAPHPWGTTGGIFFQAARALLSSPLPPDPKGRGRTVRLPPTGGLWAPCLPVAVQRYGNGLAGTPREGAPCAHQGASSSRATPSGVPTDCATLASIVGTKQRIGGVGGMGGALQGHAISRAPTLCTPGVPVRRARTGTPLPSSSPTPPPAAHTRVRPIHRGALDSQWGAGRRSRLCASGAVASLWEWGAAGRPRLPPPWMTCPPPVGRACGGVGCPPPRTPLPLDPARPRLGSVEQPWGGVPIYPRST